MKLHKILLILLLLSPMLLLSCPTPARGYAAKLLPMVESGQVPDVVYVDTLQTPELIGLEILKPIPEADVVEDPDDFYPGLLDHFRYGNGGQLYAVPADLCVVALLINEDLFAKYGLVDSEGQVTPPTNWSELEEYAWKIQEGEQKEVEGFRALGLTAGIWNFMPFLYQAQGSLLDQEGMLALNTPQAKEAFTFYTGLFRQGLVSVAYADTLPYWGAYGDDGTIAKFVRGEIAMCFGGPGIYYALQDQGAPVRVVEPLRVSAEDKPATVALVRGYGLFRDPNKPDEPADPAAVSFLRYLTSREAMKSWIGDGETPPFHMPARRSLQKDWEETYPGAKAFLSGAEYLAPPYPISLVSSTMIEELGRLSAQKINLALQPDVSADQALEYLQNLQDEGNARISEGLR